MYGGDYIVPRDFVLVVGFVDYDPTLKIEASMKLSCINTQSIC